MGGIDTLTAYPQRGVWFCSAAIFQVFGRYNRTTEAVAMTEGGRGGEGAWGEVAKGDSVCFTKGAGCAY